MDMSGEVRIPAERDTVWAALNDPEVLKTCIPGCESMEKESDTAFVAKMKAAVGPVKAKFSTNITLTNLNPPESYTISGEGKGGAAGFARGDADVRLEEDGAETVLHYSAHLRVGGKLAQVGSRLVGGAARKTADGFFRRFGEHFHAEGGDGNSGSEDTESKGATAGGKPSAQTFAAPLAEVIPLRARPAPAAAAKTRRSDLLWALGVPVALLIWWWLVRR